MVPGPVSPLRGEIFVTKSPVRVSILSSDTQHAAQLSACLLDAGHVVLDVRAPRSAVLEQEAPHVICLDAESAHASSLEDVDRWLQIYGQSSSLLLIAEEVHEAWAEQAVQAGAYEWVRKSVNTVSFLQAVRRAGERQQLLAELSELRGASVNCGSEEWESAPESTAAPESGVRLRAAPVQLGRGEILPLRELEERAILQALEVTGGSVSLAARRLGIGRATLYRRMAGIPELSQNVG